MWKTLFANPIIIITDLQSPCSTEGLTAKQHLMCMKEHINHPHDGLVENFNNTLKLIISIAS